MPFYVESSAAAKLVLDEPDELATLDLNLMFRLLQKAGLALEMLLIRSKLVML